MKPVIKNHYNNEKFVGEINNKPSLTVPDQAMTIREIINRTNKGLPVTGVRVPMYNETEDGIMPDLRNMDISEIYELKKRIQKTEKELRQKLEKEDLERKQKETEEYYKKKFGPKPDPKTEIVTDAEEIK